MNSIREKATLYDFVRMCKYFDNDYCQECPVFYKQTETGLSCEDFIRHCPDKANEIILNWCKEHPVETRQDRFLKMFPNAEINKDGVIEIFPCNIEKGNYISDCYSCPREHGFSGCGECRKNYWLAEVE